MNSNKITKNKAAISAADTFFSKEELMELERRISDIQSGKSTLKEHDIILSEKAGNPLRDDRNRDLEL